MKRRALLAAGLAVPLHALNTLDESLALLPEPASAPTPPALLANYRKVRALFNAGAHARLVEMLPNLLATAEACATSGKAGDYARLAACYDLATEALSKIGRYGASRITADRSTTYSRLSGSPRRRLLRPRLQHRPPSPGARSNRPAGHPPRRRPGRSDRPGDPRPGRAFAQMLCTVSYAAAEAGDRDRALEMISEAERAAALLPEPAAGPQSFSVTPASVTLYKVGVLWSLGDAGAAVHAGRNLHAAQFPTAERRGRLHTDMARAYWQWSKPEQTAHALLAAHHAAPSEVRDRPSIRAIVTDLTQLHPRTSGVRELAAAVKSARS